MPKGKGVSSTKVPPLVDGNQLIDLVSGMHLEITISRMNVTMSIDQLFKLDHLYSLHKATHERLSHSSILELFAACFLRCPKIPRSQFLVYI